MSDLIIPSKHISKLDLSNQNLISIPIEIFSLKNLKSLNLSNNKISEIPPEIIKLKRLEKLDVSNNRISNFYAKICQLPKLKVLNLNNNSIKSVPKQIKELGELRVLSIANNKLSLLPNEIGEIKKLEKINISKNQFEYFPKILFELKELKIIWLNNLRLRTFPIDLISKELKKLTAIYCFGQILGDDSIDKKYIQLSEIKGNSLPYLIRLNSQETRFENKKNTVNNLSSKMITKKKIFISYSHQDIHWLEKVKTNLKVLKFNDLEFEVWDDTKIYPGTKWKEEIKKALSECQIAILLISTNFLASDFVQNNELPPLLKKAEEGGTIILPLIVGHCRFTNDENLKDFQAINDPSEPLSSCSKAGVEKVLVKLTDDVERNLLK